MANDFFDLIDGSDDGVAQIVLNRPERMNTMGPAFFPALRDAVRSLDERARTRALVISSSGKHFSAGMSLDVFTGGSALLDLGDARGRLAFHDGLRRLMHCFDALEAARFPVLCAIQGGCLGGGLDLAAACDIRLCSADAFFCVQEIQIGMAADLGVLQRLPKIIPPGVAREMAYAGERLPAQRALAVGLVNAVAPDATSCLEQTLAMARAIAAKSPLAIAASKHAIAHAVDHPTDATLQHMALLQSALFDTGDLVRAVTAWKAKQAASFEPLRSTTAL